MTSNHGFKSNIRAYQEASGIPYMEARRRVAALANVMAQHPLLNTYGIGIPEPRHKSREERETALVVGRGELAVQVVKVWKTVEWLRANITPIKTPNLNSYGLKHVMEQHIGLYVINGVFIAAALIEGYSFKYTQGLNVLFGMSKRDVSLIELVSR